MRPIASPGRTPAGWRVEWTSRSAWSIGRACCSSTSPRPAWTPRSVPRCGPRSDASLRAKASRSCSRPTTSRRPTGSRRGSRSSTTGRSSPAARPTSSRPSSAAMPSRSSCATGRGGERALGARRRPRGLSDLTFEDRTVHLRVATGRPRCPASSPHSMTGACGRRGDRLRPSLDDVYLRHTGRSFAAAERTLQEAAR